MAPQKMHCAPQRTYLDNQKDTSGINLSSGEPLIKNNFSGNAKDYEVTAMVRRNYRHRCNIVALLNPESNRYRFIIMALPYHDRRVSRRSSQIRMDDLRMITLSPSEKVHIGPVTDRDWFIEPPIARSFLRPHFFQWSCVKEFVNDESNWQVLSISSFCKNPFASVEYPLVISSGSDSANSAHRYAHYIKEKGAKKLRRKATKKREKNNDLSTRVRLTELNTEVGSSRFQADCIRDIDLGINLDTSEAEVSYLPQKRNESQLSVSVNGCRISSTEALILNQETQNECRRLIGYSDLCDTEVNDPLVSDSVSLGTTTNGESCTAPFDGVKKEVSGSDDLLSGVVEPGNHARRRHRARQGTDRDRKSHAVGKREKCIRKVPQDLSFHKSRSLGNLNGHSGKENTHSVWQKVQRNDVDECNSKDNMVSSQLKNGYKQTPVHTKHHSVSNSYILSKPEDCSPTMLKVSRKVKKKKSQVSKQESQCYCKKESHTGRQNECNDDSSSVSRMSSRLGVRTKKAESVSSYRPVKKPVASSSNLEAYEVTHASVPVLSGQIVENHSLCSLPDLSEVQDEPAFFNDDKARMVREMLPTDPSMQNSGFESVPQKWVPVGGNNSGMHVMDHQSTFPVIELKVAEECSSLEAIAGEQSASYSTEVNHSSQDYNNVNAIMSGDETDAQRFCKTSTYTPNDCCSFTAKKCIVCEFEKQAAVGSESDLRNIFQAVNDAYKVQLTSEAVERVTGHPIAEVEKFMYSASPVISNSQDGNSYHPCSSGSVDASLCEHVIPNLPLGSLWEWYEKHGVCGLEVRSEDYEDSNRLGMDQFVFRAYFVPYLSAVQLFRECSTHSTENRDVGSHENKSSESSSGVGLPSVFPTLVPQSCVDSASISPQLNLVSSGESSLVCMNEYVHNQPADLEFTDDMEVLFEYFESEQPQRRRPLFEMIKELASGERPSKCRLYGDPTILESVGLHDLHPNSWFSVAWYPVYRIPDGKLRAAFLTYHSLGHLVRRGSHFVDASIVSPVAGLQWYNCQGECWFRPRHDPDESKEDSAVVDADPSEILKERMRTLEQTASLMARGVVTVGGQGYANRQPDYEFFVSRRH